MGRSHHIQVLACAASMLAGALVCSPAGAQAVPSSPAGAQAVPSSPAGLTLQVLLLNDPDFPPVTEDAARAILKEAQGTLADKLGFSELRFDVVGNSTVAQFIDRHAPKECLDGFRDVRVIPGVRAPREVPRDSVIRFLKRWKVEELRSFFPQDAREGLDGYDAIATALLAEFDRKVATIGEFKLANGESLLAAGKLDQRSYVRWICAVRDQDEADLILTNGFILYDLGSEPYPHSIFAKNKVGGASLHSPARKAIRNRAVVASTFSMVTDLDFFREEGVGSLSAQEKLEVIGTFIVAHELGHAVFKLPDFYDHPKECLMTTKYETGYVSGFREMKEHPGACGSCQPYVDARRHVFAANAARAGGKLEQAIDEFKEAIRTTPKHIDGSYLRYIAELSVDVAEIHLARGEPKQAQRWIKAALRVVPGNQRAMALRDRIAASD